MYSKVINQRVFNSQKLDFFSGKFKGKTIRNKETNFLLFWNLNNNIN